MAIYLVGDIQGCFTELTTLMEKVCFNQDKDILYLAGDLVARGPDSLATLRFVKSLGESAKVVLGNHDLHLLSIHAGIKKAKKSDYLTDLLSAHDVNELLDWLAKQPLLQPIPNTTSLPIVINDTGNEKTDDSIDAYMTHAGISPEWELNEAIEQAKFLQGKLAGSAREVWLSHMYGETPNSWKHAKTDIEKFRYSINAFTRMRYCYKDGSLEFTEKDSPQHNKNNKIVPWYELSKTIINKKWVFGHWASLMGQCSVPNVYPLDTGCVWGNHLTMLRWDDKKYFTQVLLVNS